MTFLEPQEICVCIRGQFGLQPIRPLRSCMLFPTDNDMPLLASLFGISKSKPSTPKPAGKRRASPLKDSPIQSESIVKQYYREFRTIQEKHPEFNCVPEHLQGPRDKPCWLKTKFNDLWGPTIRGEDTQGENAYMAYIKKIYGMCCLINDDPTSFSTDVTPMVTHNGQIDMEKTITNAESICINYSVDQSFAKPIVHFILWRVERVSRLFSECLRHHQGQELKRAINSTWMDHANCMRHCVQSPMRETSLAPYQAYS